MLNNEKRFLLPGEKDHWVYHYAIIFGPLGILLLTLIAFQSGKGLDIILTVFIFDIIVGFLSVKEEIWLFSRVSISEEGIRYEGRIRRSFIPWNQVASISLSEAEFDRSTNWPIICFSLRESGALHKKPRGLMYYCFNQRKYFVLKYSEDRYNYLLTIIPDGVDVLNKNVEDRD